MLDKGTGYFIVVARNIESGQYEMVFGDFNKKVAQQELIDFKASYGHEYKRAHVVETAPEHSRIKEYLNSL